MFRIRSNLLDAAPGVTRLSMSSRAEEPAGQAHKRSENASGGTIGAHDPGEAWCRVADNVHAGVTGGSRPAARLLRRKRPRPWRDARTLRRRKLYDRSWCDRGITDMILHVSAGSSWWVRGAAASVLILHISAAGIGLVSGAAALLFRKGGRLHRTAGNVFFTSMLTMCAIGACVAPFLPQPQWNSVFVAVLTSYLVATSWVTVRRKEAGVGPFEIGALLVALSVAVACFTFGLKTANSPTGALSDGPPAAYFVFGTVAALAAALDLRLILRRGVFGAQRITRHLWRMCVALLIASFSFFLGQQQVFPASVRGSPFLFVPEIVVLGLLIFWLVRVRFTNWFKHDAADRRALGGPTRDPNQAHGMHD